MKKAIVVNARQGAFWVRDGSMRAIPIPFEDEGTRHQVIQQEVIDLIRAGKGYEGLELDVSKRLNEEAEKMRALLVAQGHDVGVLILT